VTAVEQTKKFFTSRERRDLLFGSMIGATVVAIIATSAAHFIKADPAGIERLLVGAVSGGFGGIAGIFIISEIVGNKLFPALLLSVTVGIVDGALVGAAVALFPSIF